MQQCYGARGAIVIGIGCSLVESLVQCSLHSSLRSEYCGNTDPDAESGEYATGDHEALRRRRRSSRRSRRKQKTRAERKKLRELKRAKMWYNAAMVHPSLLMPGAKVSRTENSKGEMQYKMETSYKVGNIEMSHDGETMKVAVAHKPLEDSKEAKKEKEEPDKPERLLNPPPATPANSTPDPATPPGQAETPRTSLQQITSSI
eukprot:Polyplicarium_translucidae@DN1991_c1_g1_i2.p1